MKTPTLYSMIVQAEDKNRTAIETLIYALLILSAVASIWSAAVQRVTMPVHYAGDTTLSEFRA